MVKSMTRRQKRVGELIRREISTLLERKVKDPRLSFVTVTDVEVTFDLKDAFIYVSAPEGQVRKEEILEGFERASGFLRHELAQNLRIKFIPRLNFVWDDSLERGQRINQLLREIKERENVQRSDSQEP
ncbi:MAG: 30S ribosome-binding factor RbfA [Anaerolineae bacterium]|nr:30S ribosome-binding factor RbfA [Anaerolineae bacterium]MDW8101351.1 30S ribosome-binding factor RbfA [Anaerolineae bacterium]